MSDRDAPAAVRDEFAYHAPTEDQLLYMASIREVCSTLASIIEQSAIPCRYRSLAMTALEETAMWANKAVVFGHRSRSGVQHFHNPSLTPGERNAADSLPVYLGEVRP